MKNTFNQFDNYKAKEFYESIINELNDKVEKQINTITSLKERINALEDIINYEQKAKNTFVSRCFRLELKCNFLMDEIRNSLLAAMCPSYIEELANRWEDYMKASTAANRAPLL